MILFVYFLFRIIVLTFLLRKCSGGCTKHSILIRFDFTLKRFVVSEIDFIYFNLIYLIKKLIIAR